MAQVIIKKWPPSGYSPGVSDHGPHVIAVVMTVVSVAALVLTVADRHLMSLAKAGASPPAGEPRR